MFQIQVNFIDVRKIMAKTKTKKNHWKYSIFIYFFRNLWFLLGKNAITRCLFSNESSAISIIVNIYQITKCAMCWTHSTCNLMFNAWAWPNNGGHSTDICALGKLICFLYSILRHFSIVFQLKLISVRPPRNLISNTKHMWHFLTKRKKKKEKKLQHARNVNRRFKSAKYNEPSEWQFYNLMFRI